MRQPVRLWQTFSPLLGYSVSTLSYVTFKNYGHKDSVNYIFAIKLCRHNEIQTQLFKKKTTLPVNTYIMSTVCF